ncbi:MAG TPA: ion channel [Kofleriaceae bacterium]
MPAPPEVPRGSRPTRATAGYKFWTYGIERAVLRDAYHTFLRLPWPVSLGLIMAALFVANLAFAAIYYQVGGIDGAASGSFFDDLSFSVQTMATIGYGVMNPKTTNAQTVMIVESLFGIIFTALATGLVFAKFSRATARIAFSKFAVVGQHDGKPTLTLRVGNKRSNTIVEAQLRVTCALLTKTAEGKTFYKLHDLKLVRDHMTGMRRGWTVMHVIDETSPLYGLDADGLDKAEAELECALIGLDDVTMQTVHTIYIYTDKDIRLGYRFLDTMKALPNGDLLLDLTKFDAIEPDA